jgi:putative transposase
MRRTIRVQLEPSPAQARVLTETAARFTAVFNVACAYGWRERERNGVRLHHALYYPLKADHPALGAICTFRRG